MPEGGVFDRKLLGKCLADYPLRGLDELGAIEPEHRCYYFVGVDWDKFQDQAVIAAVEQTTQHKTNPAKLVLLETYEPDPDNPAHYTTILQDGLRVAEHLGAQKVVANQGEGAHQAEVPERELGGAFEPYRFTPQSRDFLVEKELVTLPIEPDLVRRAFLNVQPGEDGYEHASRELKDVFDAVGMALSEVRSGKGARSVELLTAQGVGSMGGVLGGPRIDMSSGEPYLCLSYGSRGGSEPGSSSPQPDGPWRRLILCGQLLSSSEPSSTTVSPRSWICFESKLLACSPPG